MKTVKVVAAVICNSLAAKEMIFATARGYGKFKGWWEFPGGKVEAHETLRDALHREIKEELDAEIKLGEHLARIEYDYPDFHLSMDCFWCETVGGEIRLLEAQEGRWLKKSELRTVNWLPADIELIDQIEKMMS